MKFEGSLRIHVEFNARSMSDAEMILNFLTAEDVTIRYFDVASGKQKAVPITITGGELERLERYR